MPPNKVTWVKKEKNIYLLFYFCSPQLAEETSLSRKILQKSLDFCSWNTGITVLEISRRHFSKVCIVRSRLHLTLSSPPDKQNSSSFFVPCWHGRLSWPVKKRPLLSEWLSHHYQKHRIYPPQQVVPSNRRYKSPVKTLTKHVTSYVSQEWGIYNSVANIWICDTRRINLFVY